MRRVFSLVVVGVLIQVLGLMIRWKSDLVIGWVER